MAEKLLKFVSRRPRHAGQAHRRRAPRRLWRDLRRLRRQIRPSQASRCSQCGVPFCQVHCPLNNNIPDWLKLTAEGRLEEAYEISAATNTFPEICGRICPQDRLCEGNCVIEQSGHGTVTIGAIERHVTDTAFEKGWVQAGEAGAGAGAERRHHRRGTCGPRRRPRLCAARAIRSPSMTAMTGSAACSSTAFPNFKLDKQVVARREKLLRQSRHQVQTQFRGRPRCLPRRSPRSAMTRC